MPSIITLTQRSQKHYRTIHDDDDGDDNDSDSSSSSTTITTTTTTTHISILPAECLLHIFQFLQDLDQWPTSRTNRLNLMLVCREWCLIVDSEIMWRRVVHHLFERMVRYRRRQRQHGSAERSLQRRTIEDEVLEGVEHDPTTEPRQPRLWVNPLARDALDDDHAHGEHVLVEREINEEALDFGRELPFDELPVSSGFKQFWQRLHGIYVRKRQILVERERQRLRETFFSQKLKRIIYFVSFIVLMICNLLILCMSFALVLQPLLSHFSGSGDIQHPEVKGFDPRPSFLSILFRYFPLPFAFLALMALLVIELSVAIGKRDRMDTFKWGTIVLSLILASISIVATIINFEVLPSSPLRTLTNIYHLDRYNVINMQQMIPWPLVLLPLELAIALMLLLSVAQCTTTMSMKKTLLHRTDESVMMMLLNAILLVTTPLFAFHLQFPTMMPTVFVFALIVVIQFSFSLFSIQRLTFLYGRYTPLRMHYRYNVLTALDAVAPSPKYHRDHRAIILIYWFISIHSLLVTLFTSVTFLFGIQNEVCPCMMKSTTNFAVSY